MKNTRVEIKKIIYLDGHPHCDMNGDLIRTKKEKDYEEMLYEFVMTFIPEDSIQHTIFTKSKEVLGLEEE